MLRMKSQFLKHALIKKFKKALGEKIHTIFESNDNNMVSGSLNYQHYFSMLQANLMMPCQVTKNWTVPRYFKLFFQLLNQGDKSFICEHDIFVFIQELEGVAPSSNKKNDKQSQQIPSGGAKRSGQQKIDDPLEDIELDANIGKRFKNDSGSIFTKSFVNDSILIFREMKKKQ